MAARLHHPKAHPSSGRPAPSRHAPPIAALPAELLIRIFELGEQACRDHSPTDSRDFVLSLSAVCRLWRGLTTATGSLWTQCALPSSSRGRTQMLQTWLARSGNYQVELIETDYREGIGDDEVGLAPAKVSSLRIYSGHLAWSTPLDTAIRTLSVGPVSSRGRDVWQMLKSCPALEHLMVLDPVAPDWFYHRTMRRPLTFPNLAFVQSSASFFLLFAAHCQVPNLVETQCHLDRDRDFLALLPTAPLDIHVFNALRRMSVHGAADPATTRTFLLSFPSLTHLAFHNCENWALLDGCLTKRASYEPATKDSADAPWPLPNLASLSLYKFDSLTPKHLTDILRLRSRAAQSGKVVPLSQLRVTFCRGDVELADVDDFRQSWKMMDLEVQVESRSRYAYS